MKNGKLPFPYESWEQLYESSKHYEPSEIHLPEIKMSMSSFYFESFKPEPIKILKFDIEYIKSMYKEEVFLKHLSNKEFSFNKSDLLDLRYVLQGCLHHSIVAHDLKDKLDKQIKSL